MAKLVWGADGERQFETGVDRGVLFLKNGSVVPWNGLTGVKEAPVGGEAQPFYQDGFKYLNLATAEEFEATLEAITHPPEFGECDGTVSIRNGLYATHQKRKTFDFSYRTLIGNDISGSDYGYKLHIVYNALAAPSSRDNSTINSSIDPMAFSWHISTMPPRVTGMLPTAHLIIDSRTTNKVLLAYLESLLYGNETTDPRLLSPTDLMDIFDVEFPDYPSFINLIGVADPSTEPYVNEKTNPSFELNSGLPVGSVQSSDWAASGVSSLYVSPVPEPEDLNLTFKQYALDTSNATTYDFLAQPIGAASASRRVVVAITTASARAIDSVTIGGITATIDATSVRSGIARLAFLSVSVNLHLSLHYM